MRNFIAEQKKIDLGKYFDDKSFLKYLYYQLGVYVCLNVLFMALYFTQPQSVAFLFPSIESIADKIPVIVKSASQALERGDAARAQDIVHVYGFNWLSFIVLAPAFLLADVYAAWSFYRSYTPKWMRPGGMGEEVGPKIAGLWIGVLLLIWGFCGTLDYFYHDKFPLEGRPCGKKNCVYLRDIDFGRLFIFAVGSQMFAYFICLYSTIAYLMNKAFLKTKGLL